MDPAAIITIATTCYEIGARVVGLCQTWKEADSEVQKRVHIIESCWDRTKRQVEFMSRLKSIIDNEMQRILDCLLEELVHCLKKAVSIAEKVIQRDSLTRPSLLGFGSRAKKASWVLKKEALDKITDDLENWQRRYDPSWFLLMNIASPLVDSELARARSTTARSHVTIDPFDVAAGLRNVLSPNIDQARSPILPYSPMEWKHIRFSDAKMGRTLSGNERKWYIVDTVEVGPMARARDVSRDVRLLAAKLAQADPFTFGLLNCKGVMAIQRQTPQARGVNIGPLLASPLHLGSHRPPHYSRTPSPSGREHSHFQLVFRIPEGMEALKSLRELLLSSDEDISLTRKIRIARELAKGINYVHTFNFVHKNIRPESVLCFEGPRGPHSHIVLVGFDAFRGAGTGTMMAGDMSWDKNVYRHPLRQGHDPANRYRMQHDIYSLGVCLLEIGLWEPFVEYSGEGQAPAGSRPQAKFGRTYYRFHSWMKERPASSGQQEGPASFLDSVAFKLKDYLVEVARTKLAPRMGEQYARVVLTCLTCLDDDNEDFDVLSDDASDDVVAVYFIETVMKLLDGISV